MSKVLVVMCFCLIFLCGNTFALSSSFAPGYASANHMDDYPLEWLGAQDGVADGVSYTTFAIGGTSTVAVEITLDDMWFDPNDPFNLAGSQPPVTFDDDADAAAAAALAPGQAASAAWKLKV